MKPHPLHFAGSVASALVAAIALTVAAAAVGTFLAGLVS